MILEWSDFMNKVFTKADLKSGDIITFREGSYGMYIDTFDSVIFLEDGGSYLPLTDIIDITFKDKYGDLEWDIVKIQRSKKDNGIVRHHWLEGEVIWEEKPPIEEMTLEEVCKALGKEIKIVKSK